MGQIVRSRGRRAITPIGEAHRRQIALAEVGPGRSAGGHGVDVIVAWQAGQISDSVPVAASGPRP